MTFIFDLMILNMCDRWRVMWCIRLVNLNVIGRSAAELLTINDRFFVRYRGCSKTATVIFRTRGTILHQTWWGHCQVIATQAV